jgi:hypothetical protein
MDPTSAFVPVGAHDLEHILCHEEERVVTHTRLEFSTRTARFRPILESTALLAPGASVGGLIFGGALTDEGGPRDWLGGGQPEPSCSARVRRRLGAGGTTSAPL